MKKQLLGFCLILISSQILAERIYVRPNADVTSWTTVTDGDVITLEEGDILSSVEFGNDKEVFLAPGTYKVNILNVTNNLRLYGGFSGQETTVDPMNRLLEDLDENGIIEPWEFVHEAVITTFNPDYQFTGTGVTNGTRLLVVSGIDAEVNGVTISDFHYTAYAGPISVGVAVNNPSAADNIADKKGILRFCTVKRIKSDGGTTNSGIIMSTNKYSIIDRCLIQDNVMNGGSSGGAIYFNKFGGKVTGSVIRNNDTGVAGKGGAIWATSLVSSDIDAVVENCVIYNNSAKYGGALRGEAQTNKAGIQVVNSTIVNNFTSTSGYGVELINSGIFVNSIVGLTAKDFRANTANHFMLNSAYGPASITSSNPLNSGNVTISSIESFEFINSTTFTGVMIPDHTTPFDATKYEGIQKANFKPASKQSLAVTTPGIKSLPASYTFSTSYVVPITASIPEVDMLGIDRIGTFNLDLGAYQLSGILSHVESSKFDKRIFTNKNTIVIKNMTGKQVDIYNVAGVLVFSETVKSEVFNVKSNQGIYIIKIDNRNYKVMIP